jgi:hypothetical protein
MNEAEGIPRNGEIQTQRSDLFNCVWSLDLVYIVRNNVSNCSGGLFNHHEFVGTRYMEFLVEFFQFGHSALTLNGMVPSS